MHGKTSSSPRQDGHGEVSALRQRVRSEHVIAWQELAGGVRPQPIEVFYRQRSLVDVIVLASDARSLPRVLVSRAAREAVIEHLRTSHDELGGLLIGEAFFRTHDDRSEQIEVIRVIHAVPGDEYANSAVSLSLGSGVWSKAGALLAPGRLVVGWYHSHPHIGAFFSKTDRRTQRAFFPHPYSLGWVLDPYELDATRNERMFLGADSIDMSLGSIHVDCGGIAP